MLNIYTNTKFIPSDKKLVIDVDSYFMLNCKDRLIDCPDILKNIDKCTIDGDRIIDRFGYCIDPIYVSSGTKSLVCAKYAEPDEVISLVELGDASANNISYIIDGNIYVPTYVQFYDLPNVEFHGVSINGLQCVSYEEASLFTGVETDDISKQQELLSKC